jgi:hydroxymethylpyrimidine pyrophosphatase-like HAD family hydrolase
MSFRKLAISMGISKPHEINSQKQLNAMSAEEIVKIDPANIPFYVEDEDGTELKKQPLQDRLKRNAMYRLMEIKRNYKNPRFDREKTIKDFLEQNGLVTSHEVRDLLKEGSSAADREEYENLGKLELGADRLNDKSLNSQLNL